MKEAKRRKVHSPEFKARVGLEALRGMKAVNEIGQEYGVHPGQVGLWKKEIQEQAKTLFEGKRGAQADGRAPGAGAAVQRDWQAEGGTGLAQKKPGISLS